MSSKKYTEEEFIEAVKTSTSFTQVMNKLGMSATGGGHYTAKKLINKLNLDISHFTGKCWNRGKKFPEKMRPVDDYLSNKFQIGSYRLKCRLVKENLLEYKCNWCQITEWRGQRIALELDHIDGNRENNNLSNLRILCPNCHSQTDTYNGKKKYKREKQIKITKVNVIKKCCDCEKVISKKSTRCKSCSGKFIVPQKIIWPPSSELKERAEKIGYSALGRELGVTDNAIKKRIKRH